MQHLLTPPTTAANQQNLSPSAENYRFQTLSSNGDVENDYERPVLTSGNHAKEFGAEVTNTIVGSQRRLNSNTSADKYTSMNQSQFEKNYLFKTGFNAGD